MKICKRIILTIAAAALSGFFNYLSGKYFILPGSSFIELRPQIVIPIFFGFLFGPIYGFAAGFLGDRLGYAFQGLDLLYAWNWSIGNGFIGMIPGYFYLKKIRKVSTIKDYQLVILLITLASSLPIFFASYIDTLLLDIDYMQSVYTLILPAFITDAIFGFLFIPLMLLAANKIIFTIATRNMLFITYLILPIVILTYTVSLATVWKNFGSGNFNVYDLYNIGILAFAVMFTGFIFSSYIIRKISGPIITIAESAELISKQNYSLSPELNKVALRKDEFGQLAAIFRNMAEKIDIRETQLKREVEELKILIASKDNKQEVSKIVNTEYFKDLRQKAKELRAKKYEKKS